MTPSTTIQIDPHTLGAAPELITHTHPKAHGGHPLSHQIMLGAGIALAGVVLAPYLISAVWPDPTGAIQSAIITMDTLCTATAGNPTGWAGAVAGALSHIPLVGGALAEGGMGAAMISMTVGIGGAVLGRYVDKRDDGSTHIRWGRVITTAALVTSALMGLPAIISGVSMSMIFFGQWLGEKALIATAVGKLGMAGEAAQIGSSVGVLATHFFSCVAPIFSFLAAEDTLQKTNHMPAHKTAISPTPAPLPWTQFLQQQSQGATPLAMS